MISGDEAALSVYFHMYNNHNIFLNYHFILVLHCDLLIYMRIYKGKYLLFIIYLIEYVFNIKIIIFWSLLAMKQHHICTIKRTIITVNFWIIISFYCCTLKYLSTWEYMRMIICVSSFIPYIMYFISWHFYSHHYWLWSSTICVPSHIQ